MMLVYVTAELTFTTECHGRGLNRRRLSPWASTLALIVIEILPWFPLFIHREHEGSRRMKTELLVQMDGLAKTDDLVFLLAASNLPWYVSAVLV